jgi:O-antigen ligase
VNGTEIAERNRRDVTRRRSDRWTTTSRSLLRYAVTAILLFGPLAFGATPVWARFVLHISAVILLLGWLLTEVRKPFMEFRFVPMFVPAAVFAVILAMQAALHISPYAFKFRSEVLDYVAYAGIVFVAVQVFWLSGHLRRLITILMIFGSLYAAFAILQELASNGKIYWLVQPRYVSWIFGSYVNHNHYAGLMELLAPLPIVLAVTGYYRGGQRWLAAFTGSLMAASIFLSLSRGGMIAFFAQIVFIAAMLFACDRRREAIGTLLLAALGILVVLSSAGADPVIARMTTIKTRWGSDVVVDRLAIVKDSWPMFLHKPWLGWGLGQFPVAYPQFRSFYLDSFVNEAHNDYVQFLVETGLLGSACVLALLVTTFWIGVRRLRLTVWRFDGVATLAMLTGIVGILVHSASDFNLQIPANALLFYVYCAFVQVDWQSAARSTPLTIISK